MSVSEIISHLEKSLEFRSEALRPRFRNGCVIQTPRNVHALCNATHHWCKTRRFSGKLSSLLEMLSETSLNRRKERRLAQKLYRFFQTHRRTRVKYPQVHSSSQGALTTLGNPSFARAFNVRWPKTGYSGKLKKVVSSLEFVIKSH